jgi:hypothetical protein
MVGAVGGITSGYATPVWPPSQPRQTEESSAVAASETASTAKSDSSGQQQGSSGGVNKLSREEEQTVQELKQRDAEVRRHEAAHMAAGGAAAGGASFEYEVGPDGRSYAVGGEVSIDMSEGSTPQATIQKMQTVKRAALAPADPSGQDRAVAASAAAIEAKARMEMTQKSSSGSVPASPSAAIEAYSGNSGTMPGQKLNTLA